MSADPGWMKMNAKTMVTAWVWISLATLAWFAMAEEPCWDAGGDPLTLLSDSEPLVEKRNGGGFLPVPVWKFLKDGADSSDFDRPQFRCGNMSLYLRFSLVQHSDLRLRDGRSLLLLLDRCHGSVWTFGPWLLLELPYTSCHMALKISNGKWFRQMEVSYFDYLQQASMMTVISCEYPALSWCMATPAVSCSSTNVTVKLPLGARVQRVKALGTDAVLRTLTTTPEADFVQISTQSDTDSILEIIYLDSAGEMSTILATCTVKGSKQNRHPRSLGDLNVAPNYPYSPELLELIEARDKTGIMETETSCNEDNTVTVETQVTHSGSETINIPDGPDKNATAACDGTEKQDDLPCCEPSDDLPCCEPLDDLLCCSPSEEDLSCSDHEDPPSSQSPTGVHHGPFPEFSNSQYSSHSQSISSSNQSTSNDSQHEGRPSKGHSEGHPLSDHSQSISSHVPFTESGGKTSSGGPPLLGGQPTSDYGGRPSKGHDEGHHEGLPSKGGKGSGEGRPSKGGKGSPPNSSGESHPPGRQPSSDQSQSLSSHILFTGSVTKTSGGQPLSVNQSTSDHGGHPFKGGEGSGKWHHEGRPSKGHGQGHPNGSHPLSDHSQSISSHVPFTGSSGKTTSGGPHAHLGGQPTSDHGGHPSKGRNKDHHKHLPSKGGPGSRPDDSGEGHPSKGGKGHPPGSQSSSDQSQSLSSHVPVTGSGSNTSSGGQPILDHGSRPSKGGKGLPSKGHGEGQPSKDGETHLPGSQLSSVQSQSLSSHVPVTGSGSETSTGGPPLLGGQPTSDHGGRPSKGHDEGRREGHPSKGGEARPPGSQPSSGGPPFLGGQLTSDHGGHPSKGGKGLPSTGHDKGHHKGQPSKGSEGSRLKVSGEGHTSKDGETHLPGSQLSSIQSQSLSSHVHITGSGSKTSTGGPTLLGGQPTSDPGGHPSKGGKVSRPEGSGQGRPSKGGETHLPVSQPLSVHSQSPSSHIPVTGSSSETSTGGPPFLGGQPPSDHGGHPSKGHDEGRREGHPSKGGKGLPSTGHDESRHEGQPSKGGGGSRPGGSGEGQPSKGHDEGRGMGRPSKGGETHLPGSQLSSVQSQSLSSHVHITGSGSKTLSGGPPFLGGKLTLDHRGRLSTGHDEGRHEGQPSKGGEVSRPKGIGEGRQSHGGKTILPGSQPSSVQSQSLSSHIPVTGSGSTTLSGGAQFLSGQLTSDHVGHPSKGGKGSAEGRPSKGHDEGHRGGQPSKDGEGSRPGGSGEGHPSKGGETHLPGSQLSSVQSQSLSSHVPVTGSGSKTSSGGVQFLGGQPTSDHGGHPSKGHNEGRHEGRPSKGGEGRPSKGHDRGRPS